MGAGLHITRKQDVEMTARLQVMLADGTKIAPPGVDRQYDARRDRAFKFINDGAAATEAPVRPAVLMLPAPSGKPIKHMQTFFACCPRCDQPLRYHHHVHKSPVMHCNNCKRGWPISYLKRKWSAVKASVRSTDAILNRSNSSMKRRAAAAKLNQYIPSGKPIKAYPVTGGWQASAFAYHIDTLIDGLIPPPAPQPPIEHIAAPVEMVEPQALIVHPNEINAEQSAGDVNLVVLPDEYAKLAKAVIEGAQRGAHHGTSIALTAGFRLDFTDGDLRVYLRRGKAGGKQLLIAERLNTTEPRKVTANAEQIRAFAISVGYKVPLAEIVETSTSSRASNGPPPHNPLRTKTVLAHRTGGL